MFANVTNNGATLTIDSDVNVIINANFNNNGTVVNNGYLEVNGFYSEDGGTISGDGIFVNSYPGCTDPFACNYDEEATADDGSCEYAEDNYDCDGNCTAEVDCAGECDGSAIDSDSDGLCDNYFLSFDGVNDWVQLNTLSDNIITGSDLTIEFLFNTVSNEGHPIMFSAGDNSGEESIFWIGIEDGELLFLYNNSGNYVYYGSELNDGSWHKLYLSVSLEGELIIAIDEIIIAEETNIFIDWENADLFSIGQEWDGDETSDFFPGRLDNLQLSNTIRPINGVNEPDENTIAYYTFNAGEGETLYDHSGNQNHGTINGASWVENIEGCTDPLADNYNPDATEDDGSCEYPDIGDYSLSFDGNDDYVTALPIQFGDTFTISTWIKVNPQSAGSENAFFRQDCNSNNLVIYMALPDYNYNIVDQAVRSGGISSFQYDTTQDPEFDLHQYNFYSWVCDGSNFSLYINGQVKESNDFSGVLDFYNDAMLSIGANYYPCNNSVEGVLDGFMSNIKFYDYGLNQSQIEQLMNGSFEGNPIRDYGYNENAPELLFDFSGNGNHGTINGATWSDDTP